jgi:hypothetical protein
MDELENIPYAQNEIFTVASVSTEDLLREVRRRYIGCVFAGIACDNSNEEKRVIVLRGSPLLLDTLHRYLGFHIHQELVGNGIPNIYATPGLNAIIEKEYRDRDRSGG